MWQSTVPNLLLRNKISLLASPTRVSPAHQISPSEQAYPPWCDVVHPYHPWVRPPPHNTLFSHLPHSTQKARSFMNFHKADWEVFTAESERKFAEKPLPTSFSAEEKKVFRRILGDTGRHHIPWGYVWITAALSPMMCDTSSEREISVSLTTPSTLPSSCCTGTSSGSFAKKLKTSGGLFWSPPTMPPTPSAIGPYCARCAPPSPPPTILIAFEGKKNKLHLEDLALWARPELPERAIQPLSCRS